MEDQFGGRTDDDLFYDDFEPVAEFQEVVSADQGAQQALPAAPAVEVAHAPVPEGKSTKLPPPRTLSSSRWADKPKPNPKSKPKSKQSTPKSSPSPAQLQQAHAPPEAVPDAPTPADAPTTAVPATDLKSRGEGSQGQAPTANPNARLQSGANPRQKLTDEELTVKMEKMKLLSAEKARKFEKAEQDEKQHAEAYARGMQEARKRRVEEVERRKRHEEERRKLDDERAKNRERKLKAMNMKEGGWDEGKDAILEEEARRTFRGANGGIRGTRNPGLGGSRFAANDGDVPDVDRFLDDRTRNRGRGRGRGGNGGRGRGGGRGGFDTVTHSTGTTSNKVSIPTADDFPALPPGKADTDSPSMPAITALPKPGAPPASGKWDDEMEALDEQQRAKV